MQNNEDNYRFLFENTSQGIVIHDISGKVTDCNPAAEKILGLSSGQLKGLSSFDPRWRTVHEDGTDYPGNEHPAMITLNTGKPVCNAVMGVFNLITESYTWININTFPKVSKKEQIISGVIVTFEDITWRKTIEQDLAESKLRYYTFFEQGQDGIAIINPEDGSFIEFNNQICKQLGYSREEFSRLSVFDVEAMETRQQTRERMDDLLKGGKAEFQTKHITKNGEIIDVSVSTRIISVSGKKLYHSIWRDITELTRKESEIISAKEKAEESNANILAIIENTVSSIWAINTQYQLTYVNQVFKNEFFRAFGERLQIGDNVVEKLPKPLHSTWKSRYDRVFANERFIVEDEVQDASGEKIYIKVSLCPIVSNRKIIGASVFGSNITQRKQQEQELLLAKKKAEDNATIFRNAFEYSGTGMAMVSLDKRFLKVNQAFCKMLEYTEEELVEKTFLDITSTQDYNVGLNELKQTVSGELDFFNCSKRYLKKSGDITWGNLSVSIIRNSQKEPLFWVAQIQDITVQVKFQQDLIRAKETSEENEKLFRALFRNMGNSASLYEVINNADGEPADYRYMAVNPEYERSIGVKEADLIGKTLLEVFPGTENIWLDTFKRVVVTGVSERVESYSGEVDKYFELIVYVPQKNQMALIGADITDRKKSEQEREQLLQQVLAAKEKAEESDRLKTAFLQNMSHEIRTPMNAIMGFAELLPKHTGNEQKVKYFSEIIRHRSGDLLEIINDILDIARIESGQLSVNSESFCVNDFVNDITEFVTGQQLRMKKLNISFIVNISDELKNLRISTDIIKLKQILINLISNALKFTEKGRIELSCILNSNKELQFSVSDTGSGIPMDKHEFIFERFAQLEKGKSHLYGGTGLGLSIVKALVGLLNGTIWLESQIDVGTTFYFTTRCEYVKDNDTKNDFKKVQTTLSIDQKTILLVEDDPFNMALLNEMIQPFGSRLLYAENGEEAIRIALEYLPDLILLDIGLPDLSGYEVARQIFEKRPDIKIVAQTAYASAEDRKQALNAGCADHISKPLKQDELVSILSKCLS